MTRLADWNIKMSLVDNGRCRAFGPQRRQMAGQTAKSQQRISYQVPVNEFIPGDGLEVIIASRYFSCSSIGKMVYWGYQWDFGYLLNYSLKLVTIFGIRAHQQTWKVKKLVLRLVADSLLCNYLLNAHRFKRGRLCTRFPRIGTSNLFIFANVHALLAISISASLPSWCHVWTTGDDWLRVRRCLVK